MTAARTCTCGHTADWHGHEGSGSCEHDGECECRAFAATPSPSDDFWRTDVLAAIADPTCTRDDVTIDYATALRAYGLTGEWREINEAIIERWSVSALVYVKEKAWKLAAS